MERSRYLVVDDDATARTFVALALGGPGVVVDEADDAPAALDLLAAHRYDAVVLDVSLPSMSGVTALGRFRAIQDVPVVVVSGVDDPAIAVIALEAGADDFCTKPLTGRELELRVARLVGRDRHLAAVPDPDVAPSRSLGDLEITASSRTVTIGGEVVDLTLKEFDLLLLLASAPGRVFSRQVLLELVWHAQPDWQSIDTVTEHVYRLRQKLDRSGDGRRWIETVRGAGYRFRAGGATRVPVAS